MGGYSNPVLTGVQMFIERTCNCGASLQIETGTIKLTEARFEQLMLKAEQFDSAHMMSCGYMTAQLKDKSESRANIKFRVREPDIDEDDED
jgi:hypothetical protein